MRLRPSQEAKEDHLPNPLQARKGILSLRNPNDKPQGRSIDVAEAFELPTRAPHKVQAHSPWHRDRDAEQIRLVAGETHSFTLDHSRFLLCRLCASSRAGLSQNRAAERICRISMCAWLAKLIWT
jgi:hypothetical protein